MEASSSKLLDKGDQAPAFDLEAHDGRRVSLKEFSDLRDVVLFFYPKANTGG